MKEIALFEFLKPRDIGEQLKRYGTRNTDGGYVLSPSELEKTDTIYSYGIGRKWRGCHFDYHMNLLGKAVYMYDGEFPKLPTFPPEWYKEGLDIDNFIYKPKNVDSKNIVEELNVNGHTGNTNLTAKMDIEGAEYEIFSKCQDDLFDTFSQISVELHCLWEYSEEKREALDRLNQRYFIFHIHANNYQPELLLDKYPSTLEVSYVRKDALDFVPKPRLAGYPVKNLDVKNLPFRKEVEFNWWS